jgi:hypothetical protein
MRLQKKNAPGRIDAAGKAKAEGVVAAAAERVRIRGAGKGMEIG